MTNDYLFVNDILQENKPIPEENLKSIQMAQPKGKVILGSFGIFNIKDFERATQSSNRQKFITVEL